MAQKIVYLFGAGATHAEIDNIETETDSIKVGLKIGDVTKRVLLKTQRHPDFRSIKMFLGTEENTNIELLISLFENNSEDIDNILSNKSTEEIVKQIKDLIEKDIKNKLTKKRLAKFSLHKGLLDFHDLIVDKEILHGIISLNYDSVLDDAYQYKFKYKPDYSFSSKRELSPSGVEKIPLLKLHGSFDWENVKVLGKERKISIMPLGASKNFLRLPYNFIWGRALELLIECDILRVVGCSLSANDMHLIDLLFKAHVLKREPIAIQIISRQARGEEIKARYSFFPNIITADKIIMPRIPNPDKGNIFAEWLKEISNAMLTKDEIRNTKYLRKIAL